MPSALFFYGVLRPELASGRMADLVARLGPGVAATVGGSLFAAEDPRGYYPVLAAAGDGRVHGTLHSCGPRFGPAELAELDRFEGFDPHNPGLSDYVRCPLKVKTGDGAEREADAYLWNRPVAGLAAIPHGDFARFLAATGAAPLPG